MAPAELPFDLFYSYASEDEVHRKSLEKHLAPLRREGLISDWHFRKITAGSDWRQEIDDHLKGASIVLLIVSADFIDFDYCYEIELQEALRRHDAEGTTVIPVIVRDCDWKTALFAQLQALPGDGRPVTSWPNQDEAWANVVRGIRRFVELRQTKPVETPTAASSTAMSLRLAGRFTAEEHAKYWLDIVAEEVPEGGYVGVQWQVYCGALVYEPKDVQDEIFWPSAAPSVMLRGRPSVEVVSHGALSALLAPLPSSDFAGHLGRITLHCPEPLTAAGHSHAVYLLATKQGNPHGACYILEKMAVAVQTEGELDVPTIGAVGIAATLDIPCGQSAGS